MKSMERDGAMAHVSILLALMATALPAAAITPVLIEGDQDRACALRIDGEEQGAVPADGFKKVQVEAGEHVLECTARVGQDRSLRAYWRREQEFRGEEQRKFTVDLRVDLPDLLRAAIAKQVSVSLDEEASGFSSDCSLIQLAPNPRDPRVRVVSSQIGTCQGMFGFVRIASEDGTPVWAGLRSLRFRDEDGDLTARLELGMRSGKGGAH
jgi:hypothetical protein